MYDKIENVDSVAAILAMEYLKNNSKGLDLKCEDTYVNIFLNMRGHLINMIDR